LDFRVPTWGMARQVIAEAIRAAIAEERERCAKIADRSRHLSAVAGTIADEIRSGRS